VGSGFAIDADGYIMTNAHVVNGAQRIQVVISPADANGSLTSALSGRTKTVPARIVGVAGELDLALLKVEAKLPALPLATLHESSGRARSSSPSAVPADCATRSRAELSRQSRAKPIPITSNLHSD
jgi:S1-C subfamily serine protease